MEPVTLLGIEHNWTTQQIYQHNYSCVRRVFVLKSRWPLVWSSRWLTHIIESIDQNERRWSEERPFIYVNPFLNQSKTGYHTNFRSMDFGLLLSFVLFVFISYLCSFFTEKCGRWRFTDRHDRYPFFFYREVRGWRFRDRHDLCSSFIKKLVVIRMSI